MTVREGAGFRGRKSIAAVLAAAFVCTTAAVALASTTHAKVNSAQQPTYGTILVGGNGKTLYLFTKERTGKSDCYGVCAQAFRPDYTHGRPVLVSGSGLNSALLGTTRRRNGSLQVTYNRHPLYFYTDDVAPGDIFGEGTYLFGGYWDVVGPLGKAKKPGFNPGSY